MVELVEPGLKKKVREAIDLLALGIADVATKSEGVSLNVLVLVLTKVPEKGLEEDLDDSYYSDEEEEDASPELASKGLGSVRSVPVARSLWDRFIPSALKDIYIRWLHSSGGVGSSVGLGVSEVLKALVRDGALSAGELNRPSSRRAKVIPKNSEKCSFVLNCNKRNSCDPRKPAGFKLPQIERLRDAVLLAGSRKLHLAKLDISNCFWSIPMPREWEGVFSVNGRMVGPLPGGLSPLDGITAVLFVRSWCMVSPTLYFGGCLSFFLCTLTPFCWWVPVGFCAGQLGNSNGN